MGDLTIVMYHYVRELAESEFPKIKGLESRGFSRQLDYLADNYVFVSQDEVMAALVSGLSLPERACWLTFDDGFKDHYTHVLPQLLSRGISGTFFIPSEPVTNETVLTVHRIQHILASVDDEVVLLQEFRNLCLEEGVNTMFLDEMWSSHAIPNRFDTAGTIYFKRMLQHLLPKTLRENIAKSMLATTTGLSEKQLSSQLYLTIAEIRQLVEGGMSIGGHTHTHPWLDTLAEESIKVELAKSRDFLSSLGVERNRWSMAYPYGAYDATTVGIAEALGCVLGVTTRAGVARVGDNPLTLSRLDTNDFPQ